MSDTDTSDIDVPEEPLASVEHEFNADTPPSIAVVQAICALGDIDPFERDRMNGFVLHEHIDPSALDSLFVDSPRADNRIITFEIAAGHTYIVNVSGSGRIIVRRASNT